MMSSYPPATIYMVTTPAFPTPLESRGLRRVHEIQTKICWGQTAAAHPPGLQLQSSLDQFI